MASRKLRFPVYKNIIKYRKKEKISQEEMAEILGISFVSYNSKEKGYQDFKLSEIVKIVDTLKVPIAVLLKK